MNPRTRVIVTEFWEFLAFFVNSIVFLLIGDQIQFAILRDNLGAIAITVAAMIMTRAIAIYALSFVSNRLVNSKISTSKQTVLWWSGLRGAVSIALALSVSTSLPNREALIATVFGGVLFTLLVQGLTIQPLLKKLQLLGDEPLRQQYLEVIARQTALNRVLEHLEKLEQRPGIEPEFCDYQKALIKGELERLQTEIDKLQDEYPNIRDFTLEQLRSELLAIEADTYAEFVRSGRLNRELAPYLQQFIE
jgi:CPA1 family monovalent cation:H+ antiporter